ncbi:MAG: hypothetical protein AAGI53_05390 [Planctomycetota bacterium]
MYYATAGDRSSDFEAVGYRNRVGDAMSLGLAHVGFGGPTTNWTDPSALSIESAPGRAGIDRLFRGPIW